MCDDVNALLRGHIFTDTKCFSEFFIFFLQFSEVHNHICENTRQHLLVNNKCLLCLFHKCIIIIHNTFLIFSDLMAVWMH